MVELRIKCSSYLLVHGGSSRLKPGGLIWDTIIPTLKAHHHRVFAPTLKDEHTSDLTAHIEQVLALITENNLNDIILAGHSYGGMVITGVADKIGGRLKHLVYIDAALPGPGQSLFDIITSSGRDPLSFPGLESAPPYVEKLQFDPHNLNPIPKTYILCTKSEFACVTQLAKEKIASDPKGWTYLELPTSHVPMATMPQELAQILLKIA